MAKKKELGGSNRRNDNRVAGAGEIPRFAKPTNTSVPAKVPPSTVIPAGAEAYWAKQVSKHTRGI